MAGSCGDCDLCCRLLEVRSLHKGRNADCRHLHSGGERGCAIYRTRPRACQGFECLWLESQRRTDGWVMPAEMRPDRSHVVMGPPRLPKRDWLTVHVDPLYPNAWREGKVGEYLRMLVEERGINLVIYAGELEHRLIGEAMLSGTSAELAEFDRTRRDPAFVLAAH